MVWTVLLAMLNEQTGRRRIQVPTKENEMLYVFLSSVALIIAGVVFLEFMWRSDSGWAVIGTMASGALCVIGAIGLLITLVLAFEWQGSAVKASMLNREYGTNYTREEIFYASSQIDLIRELDRKRIEVNGDFRRQRDPQRDQYQRKQ